MAVAGGWGLSMTYFGRDKSRVRAQDVANHLQISRSTVSRALAGDERIHPDTRRRVSSAAEDLGYKPNLIARSLKNQRTSIVGLVFPELDNPFYALLLQEVSQALSSVELSGLLYIATDLKNSGEKTLQLLDYQVDAVIIAAGLLDAEIAEAWEISGRPVVFVNRYEVGSSDCFVGGDNELGGRRAAQHLLESGATRFACIGGLGNTSSSRDREKGFIEELATHGLSPLIVSRGDYTYGGGIRAGRSVFAQEPEAVFCANDMMACGFLDLARKTLSPSEYRRLRVVGYDNTPMGALPGYGLTSFDQDIGRMATAAAQLVGELLGGRPGPTAPILIPPRLIVRSSSLLHSQDKEHAREAIGNEGAA